MPPSDPVDGASMLHTLLDRFEEPKSRSRDITARIDYRRVGGPAAQDAVHRVLRGAEETGAVSLERDREALHTGEYSRIRLRSAEALYGFLDREPASLIAEAAIEACRKSLGDIAADPQVEEILADAFRSWRTNKRFLGVTADEPRALAKALCLAYGIRNWQGADIDHRTFSRRVVKDSKALERQEARVANILRIGKEDFKDLDHREVLEAHGIVRRPHPVFFRAPLKVDTPSFCSEGVVAPFIGLPADLLVSARLAKPVDYVLIIENPTSFWRYCAEISDNGLIILSDGFPARDVLAGIVRLVQLARRSAETPVHHWGDIDAGGLKIAAHIEAAIAAPLRLHLMTVDLAMRSDSPLVTKTGLSRLAERTDEIGELANWLLSADGRALEQEELDPEPPISAKS